VAASLKISGSIKGSKTYRLDERLLVSQEEFCCMISVMQLTSAKAAILVQQQ
jgi:hypothetical protein